MQTMKEDQPPVTERAIGCALRKTFTSIRRMRKGAYKDKHGAWLYYGLCLKAPATTHPPANKGHRQDRDRNQAKNLEGERRLPLLTVPPAMHLDNSLLSMDRELGRGVFATCHRGYYKGSAVAVKRFQNPEQKPIGELRAAVIREAELLLHLPSHRNLPALIGVLVSEEHPMLLTELCDIEGESLTVFRAARNPPAGIQWVDVAKRLQKGSRLSTNVA